jgi:Alpha/beta hydrolase family
MATFVLVHGSCHGGWCWKKVTPLLGKDGNDVYTPTLTGLGERSHLVGALYDVSISYVIFLSIVVELFSFPLLFNVVKKVEHIA